VPSDVAGNPCVGGLHAPRVAATAVSSSARADPAAGGRRRPVAGLDALVTLRDEHGRQAAAPRPRTGWAPTRSGATSPRCCWWARATPSWWASSRWASAWASVARWAAGRGAPRLGRRADHAPVDFTFAFPAILSGHHDDRRVRRRHRQFDHRHRHLQHPHLCAHHPRFGQRHLGARVHPGGAGLRQGAMAHHDRARAAQHRLGADRAGHHPFAIAILAEAALSYLGLGTQPPQPSWGRMLSEAQTLLFQARCWPSSRAWRSRWQCWD
jgi:hypothetical protein